MGISIHKALASLDFLCPVRLCQCGDFNPQGSREPRPDCINSIQVSGLFQSTRLSRASTIVFIVLAVTIFISIHKALASLDFITFFPMFRVKNFNPQGSREPRQQNYPNLLHIPPNILCIMLFSPQFNQFSPFTQPAFTAFSSVFQVRISLAFHVSLAFAPGLKGSQLTETNSTYILHNPSFPAYILHAAKPLPPPPDTLSIQASFVPDIWLPA